LRDSLKFESFNASYTLNPQFSANSQLMKQAFELERRWATECAIRLEEHLFCINKCGKVYTDKARSLLFNLQDPKNPELKKRLLD